jgi:hypothetical protein
MDGFRGSGQLQTFSIVASFMEKRPQSLSHYICSYCLEQQHDDYLCLCLGQLVRKSSTHSTFLLTEAWNRPIFSGEEVSSSNVTAVPFPKCTSQLHFGASLARWSSWGPDPLGSVQHTFPTIGTCRLDETSVVGSRDKSRAHIHSVLDHSIASKNKKSEFRIHSLSDSYSHSAY